MLRLYLAWHFVCLSLCTFAALVCGQKEETNSNSDNSPKVLWHTGFILIRV